MLSDDLRLKVVFMGSPEFSVLVLAALLDAAHDVVGVYSQPDRPAGRGGRVAASPVKSYAVERGLPVFQPRSLRRDESARQELASLAPDLIVVAAYGLILPAKTLDVPRLGSLNIRLNDARVQADADRQAYTLAGAMVGQAALLALVLYLVAARWVSQPIVRLAGALREMQPGSGERLRTPADHAGDEIGVLISGANALLASNENALQTERQLRAEVEAMEAQYRQIFDSSSAGIFVLSQGADPTDELLQFGKQRDYGDRIGIISLGQGQGAPAAAMIKAAQKIFDRSAEKEREKEELDKAEAAMEEQLFAAPPEGGKASKAPKAGRPKKAPDLWRPHEWVPADSAKASRT